MIRGVTYWARLTAVVVVLLLIGSIVSKSLGAAAGIMALVLYIVIGRVWLRPWVLGRP